MPASVDDPKYYALAENAVNIVFGNDIDPDIHTRVKAFMKTLEESPFPGYVESVPSYVGVTVFFDYMKVHKSMNKNGSPSEHVLEQLQKKIESMSEWTDREEETNTVTIPVCYDQEFGPDLRHVAEENELTEEEVIRLHTNGDYLVYMMGFAPGFPFIGGMPKEIATPRRSEPRTKIPAGSVGIAGPQTGIYPIETPGGWQLIGQTPLTLFGPARDQPSLLKSGDKIEFKAITREEFHAYKEGDV